MDQSRCVCENRTVRICRTRERTDSLPAHRLGPSRLSITLRSRVKTSVTVATSYNWNSTGSFGYNRSYTVEIDFARNWVEI